MVIEWSGSFLHGCRTVVDTVQRLWRSLSGQASAVQLNAIKNTLATLFFLPVLIRILAITSATPHYSSAVSSELHWVTVFIWQLCRIGTRRTLTIEVAGPVQPASDPC